jgi:hypothetical protein
MKLTRTAAAALIPSTLVGIACSFVLPVAGGARAATLTAHVTRPARHAVGHARPAHHAAHATAAAGTRPATATTTQPVTQQLATQPAAGSQAGTGAATATSSQPLTAGMSSYEQCVAWRESGDNPTASSAGLFGILPFVWAQLGYPGTAGQASVALQKVAFDRLYAQYGTQPWTPSDGC